MSKNNNPKTKKWNKIKRLFLSEQIIFLVAYTFITIVIQYLSFSYFNNSTFEWFPHLKELTLILSALSLLICIVNKRIGAVLTLLPAIYFLMPVYIKNQIVNFIDIDILGILLATISFIYTVIKGHVRSHAFVFFIVLTLIMCNIQIAIVVCLSYVFTRFIYLVITDNYSVFSTLGFKKSVIYLTKAFLYWSPLLLFIIPTNYIKKQINNKICSEIYTNTLIDTTQYHYKVNLSDSLIRMFRPNKNVTSVLFIDSITSQSTLAKSEYDILNKIDLNENKVEKVDTALNNILSKELANADTINFLNYTLAINELSVFEDTLKSYKQYSTFTYINGNNIHNPSMIILKDISIDDSHKHESISLQNNINISIISAFKSMSNTICEKITEETKEINKSISKIDENSNNLLYSAKADLVNKINMHQYTTSRVITKEFNEIFPEPLLALQKCKFWEVKKLISNAIKRSINEKYIKEKINTKDKIDNKVIKIYDNIRNEVDASFKQIEIKQNTALAMLDLGEISNISLIINKTVKETVNNLTYSITDAINRFFLLLFIYSIVGAITMYYLVIQTYLYVFARVTISKKNNVFATLNTSNKRQAKGELKKCGDTYTILSSQKDIYYISRSFEPSGRPPSFCIPFKTTSIIPRLKSRTYSMNKVKLNRKGSSVHFRASGSAEFVEWTLKENEKVVFDYKNLVAISGSVQLKSVVNFRVTTLILGKLFHKVAFGPGKLILMTMGRPIISGERASNVSLAQNRIVAFNSGTRFDIDSELNIADVYLSGFYLQKMPTDLIIIDADAKGKANLGLIQHVKGLIWPF